MKYYLSIAAIVKDEDDYIREFINYYSLLGVDHFYFYDNESRNSLKKLLTPFGRKVTVHSIKGKAKQMEAYRHCLSSYRKKTRWIAFIDADEFIVPKTSYLLTDFLRHYEYADAVGINWTLFGHNGHDTKPAGLVTENYTRREEKQNIHIKSLVNPLKTLQPSNPHHFMMKEGSIYVDVKHNPIQSAFNEHHTIDVAQINHYFTKSAEEFVAKARRGRADTGEQRDVEKEFTQFKNIWNEIEDKALVEKYLPALKNTMR